MRAQVVGKPTRAFFQAVINSFDDHELPPDKSDAKIAIVGDDVETDLGGGAVELGLWRVLGMSIRRSGQSNPGYERLHRFTDVYP